jgi:nitric oxide reductase NorQ protein
VHGAILTEALASRFGVHIEVTTDWELARHLGVPAAAVNAAIALNADLAAGKLSWAPYADPWIMPRLVDRSLVERFA